MMGLPGDNRLEWQRNCESLWPASAHSEIVTPPAERPKGEAAYCSHHSPRDDLHAFPCQSCCSNNACLADRWVGRTERGPPAAIPIGDRLLLALLDPPYGRIDRVRCAVLRSGFSWFGSRPRHDSTSAHLAERDDY